MFARPAPDVNDFSTSVFVNTFQEEQEKRLFTFIKQCLLTISTQNLQPESLVLSLKMLW